MIVIGLTGGIGSGKTTVAQMLAELGAIVLDSDKLGHETLRPGSEAWQDVVRTFGREILKPNNEIDRSKLGTVVFNDTAARSQLNHIMHPRMSQEVQKTLEQWRASGVAVAVVEAAVLLEAHWEPLVDQVWVTTASQETVIHRLVNKGLTAEQAQARIASQLSPEERLKRADRVIDTECDLSELRVRVKQAWQKLQT